MEFTTKYRSKFVIRAMRPFIAPGSKVLDVGCGNCIVSWELHKSLNCNLIGTDILEYKCKPVEFKRMTQDNKLDFESGSFDSAVFVESLHHMPMELQLTLIQEALRVASQVLIFEVEPNPVLKWFDFWINQFHNPNMAFTFAFRTKVEWMRLFEENHISVELGDVKKPFFGVWFTCHLFRLKRKTP